MDALSADELGDYDRHESGACGGVGDLCRFCDEAMAARVKDSTPREFACRTCGKETGGPARCFRCQYKYDQLEAERLYDWATVRDERD